MSYPLDTTGDRLFSLGGVWWGGGVMHWDVSQLVGGRKSGAGVEVGKEQGGSAGAIRGSGAGCYQWIGALLLLVRY